MFTSALNERLIQFIDTYSIIYENQAGFRSKHSTVDYVFTLNFLINLIKSSKQQLYVAFVDFSRAFDNVPRAELFQKLIENNINGKFLRVIRNMYENVKSCVQSNGKSPFFACACGVRQGENLSPLLFSIFLNDLINYLTSNGNRGVQIEYVTETLINILCIVVLLFADDTVLISRTAEDLQKCLNDFQNYCQTWKLKINTGKTKVMVFGSNKRGVRNLHFELNGAVLDIVDHYKYLGVVFSSTGSFNKAREHLISQARKAMHLLYRRIYNLNLPIDLQLKLFDNTILSILLLNCEVWGYENVNDIEKVHIEFLRRITNSRKSTPSYMIYGELGRFPLEILIKSRKYWNSLILSDNDKYSRIVYNTLIHSNKGLNGWNLSNRFLILLDTRTYTLTNI